MKIVHGSSDLPLMEQVNKQGCWALRWNRQQDGDNGYAYCEEILNQKPTLTEVKDIILDWVNSETDNTILCGYVWHDMPVWLSTENQFNYKAAYDLAIQTNGESLPVTFKFGTTEEPVYYEFSTKDELNDFYSGAMSFINNTLYDGWQRKDSMSFDEYKQYFKQAEL